MVLSTKIKSRKIKSKDNKGVKVAFAPDTKIPAEKLPEQPKSTGFSGRKYTQEEKDRIKLETLRNVNQGLAGMSRLRTLGLSDTNNSNINPTDILLAKLRQADEDAQWRDFKNKTKLRKLRAEIPDLGNYDYDILKRVIDNSSDARFSGSQDEEYFELADRILKNPKLVQLFDSKDAIHEDQKPPEIGIFLNQIGQSNQKHTNNLGHLAKAERSTVQKIHQLANDSGNTAKFSELKKVLPDLQEHYNRRVGNMPDANISRLTYANIDQTFPIAKPAELANKADTALAELQTKITALDTHIRDLGDQHASLTQSINDRSKDLLAYENEIVDLGKIVSTDTGIPLKEDSVDFIVRVASHCLKFIADSDNIDAGNPPVHFLKLKPAVIQAKAQKIKDSSAFPALLKNIKDASVLNTTIIEEQDVRKRLQDELPKLVKELEELSTLYKWIENQPLSKKLEDVIDDFQTHKHTVIGNTAPVPLSPTVKKIVTQVATPSKTKPQTPMRKMFGQGLVRKAKKGDRINEDDKGWGLFKNGRPRRGPSKLLRKQEGYYKPRNKLHWLMKTDQGKFVGGSLINYDEIKQKLLNVKASNQQQKALDMLDSISDILTKKEYDDVLQMLLN